MEEDKNLNQSAVQNPSTEQSSSVVPPVPETPKPKFKLPILIVGIIIFLLLIGIASAAFIFLPKSSPNKQKQTEAVLTPQPTTVQTTIIPSPTSSTTIPSPTPSPDPTASWKTYTSSKANYSFKYPTEWPLVNVPTSQGCDVCVEEINFTPKYNPNSGDGNVAIIHIFKEDNIKTLDDYVNIHVKSDSSKVNFRYTTVGGEKAVSYTLSGGIPPLPVIEYTVVKNGMYYIIRLDDSIETNKNRDGNLRLFNTILSTFKFTN